MARRVSIIAVGIVMALAFSFGAYVNTEASYAAASGLIVSAKADLAISNGTAAIKLTAESKQAKTIKMQGTATLQKYKNGKWVNVVSSSKTTTEKKLTLSGKCSVPKKGSKKTYYRVKGTVKAIKLGQSQTVVVYSKTVQSY